MNVRIYKTQIKVPVPKLTWERSVNLLCDDVSPSSGVEYEDCTVLSLV
jgi:hypothetical protein